MNEFQLAKGGDATVCHVHDLAVKQCNNSVPEDQGLLVKKMVRVSSIQIAPRNTFLIKARFDLISS